MVTCCKGKDKGRGRGTAGVLRFTCVKQVISKGTNERDHNEVSKEGEIMQGWIMD